MTAQWTCGQGLAARSPVPIGLGTLVGAIADVLEIHTRALDLGEENGRRELKAYLSLVARHRDAATLLRTTGEEMAGYGDLPMAGHDVTVLMSYEAVDAFARVVAAEDELVALLEQQLAEDRSLLEAMRKA